MGRLRKDITIFVKSGNFPKLGKKNMFETAGPCTTNFPARCHHVLRDFLLFCQEDVLGVCMFLKVFIYQMIQVEEKSDETTGYWVV